MSYNIKFNRKLSAVEFGALDGYMYYDWKAFIILRKQDATLKYNQCFIYNDGHTYYCCALIDDEIHIYDILSKQYSSINRKKVDRDGIIPKSKDIKQAFKDCYSRYIRLR